MSLVVAMENAQEDVLRARGGFGEESLHCVLLASNRLKEAISNYVLRKSLKKKLKGEQNDYHYFNY